MLVIIRPDEAQNHALSVMVACPVRPSEDPAKHVVQVVSGALQRVNMVDGRATRRWKLVRLRGVEVGHHPSAGYPDHVIGVDESQAVLGGDHNAVEDVELRYFKDVLEVPDGHARAAEDRGVEYSRLVGNSDFAWLLCHSRAPFG
jgi:hypothetical protein